MRHLLAGAPQPALYGAVEGGRLKSFRTPDQLVRIYNLDQEGKSGQDIAEEVGITPGSVATSLHTLKKYLKGKDRNQSKRSNAYRLAAKVIRRDRTEQPLNRSTAPQPQPQATPRGDNFTFLERSYRRFEADVSTFIEVETNSRVTALKDENTALKEDLQTLRKEVERLKSEIERLKEEAQTPQTVNWVDQLQTKLSKEEK